MDFKAAGTKDGVTAIQMDTKARALPVSVFAAALGKSKNARLKVLEVMEKAMPEPKKEVSMYAPKVATEKIPVEKIGELIGPGGKNIRALSERLNCLEIKEMAVLICS
jgi:polyribonucleotide nucleotidyltransferase